MPMCYPLGQIEIGFQHLAIAVLLLVRLVAVLALVPATHLSTNTNTIWQLGRYYIMAFPK